MANIKESFLCHICVETHQNVFPSGLIRGGYRQDLLESNLTPLEKSAVICCSCEGVMREPQFTDKGYKCRSCLDGEEGRPAAVNQTEINKLRVRCPFRQNGCDWRSTVSLLVSHVEECGSCPVSCPLGCSDSIQKKDLKKHEDKECLERKIKCKFCLIDIKVSQRSNHFKMCRKFPIECPNRCETPRIPRESMNFHISNNCPLTSMPCSFKKYGCNVQRKRKDIDSHETAFVVKHVRMMNTHMEKMNTRIEEMEEVSQYSRGLKWEITGIKEKFEKKERLLSDSFYVNTYKFVGLADFGRNTSNCLGIYIDLCVGVHDDSLMWPFIGNVIVTLVNMRDSNNSRTDSYKTENNEYFIRRTDDLRSGFGFPTFATKDEILNEFSNSDSLTMKIEIQHMPKSSCS